MTLLCPVCGSDEGFEKRGEVRRYIKLDDKLEEDTWNDGDYIEVDIDDAGNEVIYCLECDSQFSKDELQKVAA